MKNTLFVFAFILIGIIGIVVGRVSRQHEVNKLKEMIDSTRVSIIELNKWQRVSFDILNKEYYSPTSSYPLTALAMGITQLNNAFPYILKVNKDIGLDTKQYADDGKPIKVGDEYLNTLPIELKINK